MVFEGIAHDIAQRSDRTLLADSIDTRESLLLDRRVPVRLHEVGTRGGGKVQTNSSARDGEQGDTDAGILAEVFEDFDPFAVGDFAVEADVADGSRLQGLFDDV